MSMSLPRHGQRMLQGRPRRIDTVASTMRIYGTGFLCGDEAKSPSSAGVVGAS